MQLKQLKVLKNLSCDSDFLPRFVARRYQRVLLVADETIEDVSTVDTAESVKSGPHLDDRLATEQSGGGNVPNKSAGLAADGGDPSVAEMLNVLLSARRSKNIASKCDLIHKFSSRPDLKLVFSETWNIGQLQRRLRADSGEHMNDEHAKRGRFKGTARGECSDEAFSEFFSKMSMESSGDGAAAVPPESILNKCLSMAIRHLSARLDVDAARQLKDALDEIQVAQGEDTFSSYPLDSDNDKDLISAEVVDGVRALMELGAAMVGCSDGLEEAKESSYPDVLESHSRPANLSTGLSDEPIEPFMMKVQEERARMVDLFKAVSPGKLAILDDLVEKHSLANDFDHMWVSYEQKWGIEAVEKAFAKVQAKKKGFYRAKMTALLAHNEPDELEGVDELMAKHAGNYDQMFRRWVEVKKFDTRAVAVAHSEAMKEIESSEE